MSNCCCGDHEDCHCEGCMCCEAAANVRMCFRLLWEQHVYWTRMTITAIAFDLPSSQAVTKRLLRNPADFARLFCYYYGNEIASEFSRLVRDHLVIAEELIKAAKAGNNELVVSTERKWYGNADEIVCFLNHINPYWPIKQMRTMWYEHLALTKTEAVAELGKDYSKSIETFNRIENEALMMADDFASGLICQFQI